MIPLYKPYMPDELLEVSNILHSGQLAYGKWGVYLEKSIAKFIGAPYVLCTNSYNSAMLLALATLEIGSGDEVIASPMSCLASNQPFVTQGTKVVWADIDPVRGTLEPNTVRSKITSKTRAIFHNHHCGYPGYIDEINEIGNEYNIEVVDDAIEAFGSKYKGQILGNVGTPITVFSFETVRLPNCIMGGALVFEDEKKYTKAKRIRDYGVNRENFRDAFGEINPQCDIDLPGFGIKPAEINSYIGSKQIETLPKLLNQQTRNGSYWTKRLEEELSYVSPINASDTNPNYWVYGTLVDSKREFILKMRDLGYYASGVHLNNNRYSVFGNQSVLPGVEEFYSKFVALPCGWWVDFSNQ